MEKRVSNDELLKEAIQEIAQALLYKEYGKDMRNEEVIRMLAEGRFSEFIAMKSGEPRR